MVYILTLLLPVHCQDNSYYQTVVHAAPVDVGETLVQRQSSMHPNSRRNLYFDEHGNRIPNLATYNGVLYVFNMEQHRLKGVRKVVSLTSVVSLDMPHGKEELAASDHDAYEQRIRKQDKILELTASHVSQGKVVDVIDALDNSPSGYAIGFAKTPPQVKFDDYYPVDLLLPDANSSNFLKVSTPLNNNLPSSNVSTNTSKKSTPLNNKIPNSNISTNTSKKTK